MSGVLARWLSDEYQDEIREYERKAFYLQVQEEQEKIVDALRTEVSTWTENEILDGNTPTLEEFCDRYREWDHEQLYDIIEAEINRIAELCRKEAV